MDKNLEYKIGGLGLLTKDAGQVASNSYEIYGYASMFGGPPDHVNDIVEKHAYRASLARTGQRLPFLWSHKVTELPLGQTTVLIEDHVGLLFRATIAKGTQKGDDLAALMRAGIAPSGVSIGYKVDEARSGRYKNKTVRYLKVLSLHELSLCTLPAKETARVTGSTLKSVEDALIIAMFESQDYNSITELDVKAYLAALDRRAESAWRADTLLRIALAELDMDLLE